GEGERADVDLALYVEQELGQKQSGGRSLHEAVAAETRRAPETLQLGHRAEDGLVVGSRLVQVGPRCLDSSRGQRGGATSRLLEHLVEELPIDLGPKP